MQSLNATVIQNDDALGYAIQFTGSDGTPLGVVSAGTTIPGFGINFYPGGITTIAGNGVHVVVPAEGGQFTVYVGAGNAVLDISPAGISLPGVAEADPHSAGKLYWNNNIPTRSLG